MKNEDIDMEVENYEHNLRLQIESHKDALRYMITSVMPTQLSNIKTILWINFLTIGFIAQLFQQEWSLSHSMFIYIAVTSIIICLWAMAFYRDKYLGNLTDIEAMSKLDDNKWTKSQALFDILYCTDEAVKNNTKNHNKRSDLTHIATILTSVSIVYLCTILVI